MTDDDGGGYGLICKLRPLDSTFARDCRRGEQKVSLLNLIDQERTLPVDELYRSFASSLVRSYAAGLIRNGGAGPYDFDERI